MSNARAGARRELGDLVALALPLSIGHLGHQFMQVVDSALLGRYSDASLAGSGISGGILFAATVVGIGTLMGLDTLVPQALGAGEDRRARTLMSAGFRLAFLLSVPTMLVVGAAALLLSHTPVEPSVAAEASRNLFGRLPGIPPLLLYAAMRSFLQAHHVTRPMVIAMVVGNLINLVAAWLLIYGDGGLERIGLPALGIPAMGALGAGIATSGVAWISALIVAIAVAAVRRRNLSAPAPAALRSEGRAIVRLGAPVGLQLLAEVGVFALTGILAGTLGRHPSAAHQIALTLASFSFSMALGVGAATSVKVGRAVGAGDPHAARRAGGLGMMVGACMMGAAGMVFLLAPHSLASLFTDDEAVRTAAVPLLRVAAFFALSDAIQAVSAGALRGAGDTRFTFVANLIGHYAIGVPIAVLLGFRLELGASGLWWGLSGGLTAVAVAQSIRFRLLTRRPIERALPVESAPVVPSPDEHS